MQLKFNKNLIFALSLFLLMALPGWYMLIGSFGIKIPVIISLFLILMYISLKFNNFISDIRIFVKSNCSRGLLLFGLWIIFAGFFAIILYSASTITLICAFIIKFLFLILLPFFCGFMVAKKYSFEYLIKFYVIFLCFILGFGVLDFLLSLSSNTFLHNLLLNTLANNRTLQMGEVIKVTTKGMCRVQSLFDEPANFGFFICVHLPMIYNLSKCKINVFRHSIINKNIIKSLPYITWLLLIGTMSPIFLVLGVIISIAYVVLKTNLSKRSLYTNTFVIGIILFLIYYVFSTVDVSNTFLSRIVNTVANMSSFNDFVSNSPSLANRIINYINLFIIFLHHPITGVGFGNIKLFIYQQLMVSPVPLTSEILGWLSDPKANSINLAILWHVLAETGIVGTALIYSIFFNAIKNIKRKLAYLQKDEKMFMEGLYYAVVILTILTIYNSRITEGYMWGILGIAAGFAFNKRIRFNNYILINKGEVNVRTDNG